MTLKSKQNSIILTGNLARDFTLFEGEDNTGKRDPGQDRILSTLIQNRGYYDPKNEEYVDYYVDDSQQKQPIVPLAIGISAKGHSAFHLASLYKQGAGVCVTGELVPTREQPKGKDGPSYPGFRIEATSINPIGTYLNQIERKPSRTQQPETSHAA